MPRTTVVYAPHQDDETLRLTGYIRAVKALRPDENFVLVAVTDGEASGIRTSLGFTSSQFKKVRRAEQVAAWSYLTGDEGNSEVIRLRLPDGGVRAQKSVITAKARELEALYGTNNVEHYLACRLDDSHDDHRATAEAVRDAGVRVVRYSREPGQTGGTKYLPGTGGHLWSAERADAAYWEVGHKSVPGLFENLRNSGYASYISAS